MLNVENIAGTGPRSFFVFVYISDAIVRCQFWVLNFIIDHWSSSIYDSKSKPIRSTQACFGILLRRSRLSLTKRKHMSSRRYQRAPIMTRGQTLCPCLSVSSGVSVCQNAWTCGQLSRDSVVWSRRVES